jgi:hypothetical protein
VLSGEEGVVEVPVTAGLVGDQRQLTPLEASASVPGVSTSADADGVAFGGGAQYMFTPKFGMRGDYTRLEGEDDGVDTFAASAVVKF